MKKRSVIALPLCIIAGAAGCILRTREWATALHGGVGLADEWTNVTVALAALSAAVVLFCIINSVAAFPKGCDTRLKKGKASKFFQLIAGALVIAGAVIFYLENGFFIGTLLSVVLVAMGILSGAYIIVSATSSDEDDSSLKILSLAPPIFSCIWTLLVYRAYSTEPQLIKFVYNCLSYAAATMTFYYISGYRYGRKAPRGASVAILLCVYFSLTALLDSSAVWMMLMRVGFALAAAAEYPGLLRSVCEPETAHYENVPAENEEPDE